MSRRVGAPYWGKVGNRFVDFPVALGERHWRYRLAPGIVAHVTRNVETGLCEYMVLGLGFLEVWRSVTGGPQHAANTARREVLKLCAKIGAAG